MPKLLLIGTGNIAASHVREFGAIRGCTFVACADPVPGRAQAFAREHGIARAFESLADALDWGKFDAVVNCTPDAAHKATSLAAIAAGKHVLCEKPLAPTAPDALDMAEAVEAAGLINLVNLSYRNAPAIQRARSIVEAGGLGELRHVEASYRQSWLVAKYWGDWRASDTWLWRLSTRHGSTGVLGDVGVHIIDFATYGACEDVASVRADVVTFPKAEGDRVGHYVLDANDSVAMTARLSNGALATILATRYATGYVNELSLALHGTKGALRVETDGHASRLLGCLGADVDRGRWKKLETPPTPRNAERFAKALRTGINGDPTFRRAADVQKVIDAAFKSGRTGRAVAI
ncbi:MAG: Gfo/Idh/MocA family oxidoreductase [Rhizobiaceae bacterium]|nr:Gfo/Idh/MocA family oxidoreductase [Rhizobiaceae bacterium]